MEPEVAEVLAALGPRAVLSHHDAARAHGIDLVADDGSHHATVPRNHGRPRCAGWTVHRADVAVVTLKDGTRVTGPLHTVLDLCRVLPLAPAVACADAAVRLKLVTFAALVAALGQARGRGAARPRAVARLLDERCGSVLESLLRVLLLTSSLPAFTTQQEIRDELGHLIGRVDFCWVAARLVVEADGFAFHSDRASYRTDRWRMNELERLGWRVLRFTWEDVQARPRYVTDLIRDCLQAQAQAA